MSESARPTARFFTAVSELACPKCGVHRQFEHTTSARLRLNSVTSAARCARCGYDAFLKYPLTADRQPAVRQAEQDFAVAIEFNALFPKQSDLGVIAPTSREGAMLVFDFIPGATPVAQLKAATTSSAASLMRRLGTWFGRFHLVCNIGEGPVDLAERLDELSAQMGASNWHNDIASRTMLLLGRTCSQLPRGALPYKRLHGDAKPENFWLAGSRLLGLDIDASIRNLPERDLSQFLCNFELTCSSAFGHLDDSRRSALEYAFIDGYRQLAPINEEILNWVRAYDLLRRCLAWRDIGPLQRLRWDRIFSRRLFRFAQRKCHEGIYAP